MSAARRDSCNAKFSGVATSTSSDWPERSAPSTLSTMARHCCRKACEICVLPPKLAASTASRLPARSRKSRKRRKCAGISKRRKVWPRGAVSITSRSYFCDCRRSWMAISAAISAMPGRLVESKGSISLREKKLPLSSREKNSSRCRPRNFSNSFSALICQAKSLPL